MKYLLCIFLAVTLLFGCKNINGKDTDSEIENLNDSELEELITLMTGSFSSKRQSSIDTSYKDVTLHMYPIWPEKEGKWIYVEQSLSDRQEEPYRQRIYKLSRENDSILRSDIYTIPNANLWACKWQTPEFFERLLIESIQLKEGCEVLIKKTPENTYVGKTIDKNCPSELNGATYSISEVIISKNKIISWDRGFDKKDSLMWGAKNGGYEFDKLWE